MANNVLYANTSQLDEIADLLKGFPKEAVRVMNDVIHRTTNTVRVEAGRQIPTVFAIKQSEIREALNSGKRKVRTITGTAGEGSISVEVVGRPLTVTRFQCSPKSPPSRTKKGKTRKFTIKAMIRRASGMKAVGPVVGLDGRSKSVFLMPVKSGSERYVFARRTGKSTSTGHEEVKVLRTVSIPQMVTDENVGPKIVEKVNETMFKRLTHDLDRDFGNLGANLSKGVK